MDDARTLDSGLLKKVLVPRNRDWHKGNSGTVGLIGGNIGMSGAIVLAAMAALRVGSGLVRIASHPRHADSLNLHSPELMCIGVEEAAQLSSWFEKVRVIVIGPGLGQDDWARGFLDAMQSSTEALVVDGDALNLLSVSPLQREEWILTPHPGEAARLLNVDVATIQSNRQHCVKEIARKYHCICVLKGAGTLIASADGSISECSAGNPGMATAGMGDVLSGVISGLVAQGVPLLQAAEAGVLLHAMAADSAAEESGARGLIASDLFPYLRRYSNP